MSGPQVFGRTDALIRARNRLDAELARTVREGELTQASDCDGLKTMQSWLRGQAHLSPSAAGQLVRNGRALEHLPVVASAFADGRVTAEQVAVVAPITREDRRAAAAEQDVDLAAVDATLAASPRRDRSGSWRRWCITTWPDSTPTAPSPIPPNSARSASPGTPTGA